MPQYALVVDLVQLAINASALASISAADQQAALDSVSAEMDGYFADQYTLPLLPIPGYAGTGAPFPPDLKQHVCDAAAYRLMKRRGFFPEGNDTSYREAHDDTWKWAREIAQGLISPPGFIDSTPATREGGPVVITGMSGNTIGGNVTPSVQLGGVKPYPFPAPLPGKRGW